MYILLVEDQAKIATFINYQLVEAGHTVDLTGDAQTGLEYGLATDYDALVLKHMLPHMDGLQVLRELRRRGRHTPVLMLTARHTIDKVATGLDPGCDTLVKPFAFPELAGRLQALVRRPPLQTGPVLPPDDLTQDTAAHQRTAERFQGLFELVPYATLVVDEQGRIVLVNWQAEQLFGYGRDEIVGRPIENLIPERFRRRYVQHQARYLANPRLWAVDGRHELYGLRRDGTEFPVEIGLNPLVGDDGMLVSATIRDITRRKQEEDKLRRSRQQLRELSACLLSMREEERTRIARAIHDDLGQALTALKMDLAWLQKRLDARQKTQLEKTRDMAELIDTIVQTVRGLATELRPGILDDIGLLAAIEWQLQEFQRRTDIACELTSSLEEISLDEAGATTVFRIFQEALTNVARHAQASRVEVSVEETAEALIVHISDNGRGITPDEHDNPKSIGLLGMRERAWQRGGEVRIQGTAGKGTAVTIWLPLDGSSRPGRSSLPGRSP